MLKSLISFGASRALCQPHRITLNARPSRRVQNFLKTEQLKRLDATLVDLIAEQPERILGFSAIRLMLHTGMRKGEVRTPRRGKTSTLRAACCICSATRAAARTSAATCC